MNLPDEPGFYLWYILDFGYMNVGLVQVRQESTSHLEYLQHREANDFYIYESGFITLVLYHQAHDHLPPLDENKKPIVDGYIPFDFRTVGLVKPPPMSLIPKQLPEKP